MFDVLLPLVARQDAHGILVVPGMRQDGNHIVVTWILAHVAGRPAFHERLRGAAHPVVCFKGRGPNSGCLRDARLGCFRAARTPRLNDVSTARLSAFRRTARRGARGGAQAFTRLQSDWLLIADVFDAEGSGSNR